MTEQRAWPLTAAVLGGTLLLAIGFDLYALLLLPLRLAGHLVPAAPLLVLVANAGIGWAGNRLLASRLPAQVLLGFAVVLSTLVAGTGPGGDVIVTRSLQGMYLLYVGAAVLGAAAPLLFRPRS